MHILQKELIKRLVTTNDLRFKDLTIGYSADDNILFHLKQLVARGLITKRDDLYHLTSVGLVASGEMSLDSLTEQKYKTLYIGFICKCNDKYLLRQRGADETRFYKFPGHKPLLGESMNTARQRLFKLETGLTLPDSQFTYRSTHFKVQYTSSDEVLFDDVLVLYYVDISDVPSGEITLRNENNWFTLEEIKALMGKWPEIDLELIKKEEDKQIYEYSFVNNYTIHGEDL